MGDEVNLLDTNLKSNWNGFVGVMLFVWVLVFCVGVFLSFKTRQQSAGLKSHRGMQKHTNTMQLVLFANVLVGLLRVLYFIDPRGWHGYYPVVFSELLLRLGMCVMLAQWLLVVMRWYELGEFAKDAAFHKLVAGSAYSWRGVVVFICVLTTLIITLTAVAESANMKGASSAVNLLLGLYVAVFTVAGIFSGIRAARTLYGMSVRRRHMTSDYTAQPQKPARPASTSQDHHKLPRIGTDDLTLPAVISSPSPPARQQRNTVELSIHQRKTLQIFMSVLVATPCAIGVVIISIWRGAITPTPTQYMVYLVVRHTLECVLCGVLFYAIQRDPALVVNNSMALRISVVVTRGVSRQVMRSFRLNSATKISKGGLAVRKSASASGQTTSTSGNAFFAPEDKSNPFAVKL